MPRSAVLTGRIDARDRAKARHRHDRRPTPTGDAREELARFLDAETARFTWMDDLERYDLDSYLRATGAIDRPAHERLRQLAIRLEVLSPATVRSSIRAWLALDRVYALAVRLAPADVDVWISRGISAMETMRGAEESDAGRRIAEAGTRERAGASSPSANRCASPTNPRVPGEHAPRRARGGARSWGPLIAPET